MSKNAPFRASSFLRHSALVLRHLSLCPLSSVLCFHSTNHFSLITNHQEPLLPGFLARLLVVLESGIQSAHHFGRGFKKRLGFWILDLSRHLHEDAG
jgi:hypothetical protein